ncbi:hypothetical protein ACX93W_05360 [Paenibacillus sp. CAU 1782]
MKDTQQTLQVTMSRLPESLIESMEESIETLNLNNELLDEDADLFNALFAGYEIAWDALEEANRENEQIKDTANHFYLVADSFRQILGVGTNDDDGISDARKVIADKDREIERLRSEHKLMRDLLEQIDNMNREFSPTLESYDYAEMLVDIKSDVSDLLEELSPKEDKTDVQHS